MRILHTLPAHPRIGIKGFAPDGIAVAANGTIYLNTYRGNGFASKTALIAIEPTGKVRVIWGN
jgi:sugar lactone lactonase YvrE